MGAGKNLTEGQPGNPVEEGVERLRATTDCDPEVGQHCDLMRTLRDLWESVAAHFTDHGGTGFRDDVEQSHGACVHKEEIERPFCPTGHGNMM